MTRERKRDESETTHQIRVYADRVRENFPAGMAWQFISNHAPYIAEHLEKENLIETSAATYFGYTILEAAEKCVNGGLDEYEWFCAWFNANLDTSQADNWKDGKIGNTDGTGPG